MFLFVRKRKQQIDFYALFVYYIHMGLYSFSSLKQGAEYY